MKRTVRLPQRRQEELSQLARRSREVVLMAAITGVVTGLVVALFDRLAAGEIGPHLLDGPPRLGAIAPGARLSACASLRVLRLSGCGLTDAGADALAHALFDWPLRELDVRHNAITDHGARLLRARFGADAVRVSG